MEPFWEDEYRDEEQEAFGAPSAEVVDLVPRLPPKARVLDLGCGSGRNALPLAKAGFDVHAVDRSVAGIDRLKVRADMAGVSIRTTVVDLSDSAVEGDYDLVILHGVLHLLAAGPGRRLVSRVQAATKPGGWNVVVVFTDRLPQPPDLAPFVLNAYPEGGIAQMYSGWDRELAGAYTLEDEHAGGLKHRHAVNKVVARLPPAPPR